MSNRVRYVFDTNVIISALLFENSKPDRAFQYALANGEVLLSLDLLEELNEVLGRKKFSKYVTNEEKEEFLETLIERAVLIEIVENVQECRDPKDDKILELALNGEAQYIITGGLEEICFADRDLLVLNPFRNVRVITVEDFLKTI